MKQVVEIPVAEYEDIRESARIIRSLKKRLDDATNTYMTSEEAALYIRRKQSYLVNTLSKIIPCSQEGSGPMVFHRADLDRYMESIKKTKINR